MNTMQHMKDPAAGVPPQLLPHMHLVSKHRYPTVSNLSLETIVGYLMEAPKIMRDLQPVQWQFLDPAPQEGRLLLVWQPLEHVGTSFASDGYVWGDPEQAFKSDVRGYTLEMFLHRSGYQAPNEPMASHCRKRYRLLPGNPALSLPAPDPSLWIIHYGKAAPRDHIPAASIQISPYIHTIMQQRRVIQSSGPLVRKDFMLHDRANWPTINPPPGMATRNPSIPTQAGHRRGPSVNFVPGEATLEEEEDVSRGDTLDFMSARDISRVRYEQHHEWMEEILESHYATKNIIPTDLGLGRKGELEALTRGIFDAPISVLTETTADSPTNAVGKIATDKAEEFRRRAASKVREMEAEIEKMRKRHAKRMEKLRKTATLSAAEKNLRHASFASDGPTQRSLSTGGTAKVEGNQQNTADAIVEKIEEDWGRKIESITNVNLVEKGGLDERPLNNRNVMSPTKSVFSPTLSHSAPNQPTVIASNLANPQHPPMPPQPQREAFPQQVTQLVQESVSANTSAAQSESESTSGGAAATATSEKNDTPIPENEADLDIDTEMAGFEEQDAEPEIGIEDNTWVMVDEDGGGNIEITSNASRDASQLHEVVPPHTANAQSADSASSDQKDTPAGLDELPLEIQPQEDPSTLETGEFQLSGDFDDVDVGAGSGVDEDTAGDALEDYGAGDDELDLDTMDDSAFADAFHAHEEENTPMDDHENSL